MHDDDAACNSLEIDRGRFKLPFKKFYFKRNFSVHACVFQFFLSERNNLYFNFTAEYVFFSFTVILTSKLLGKLTNEIFCTTMHEAEILTQNLFSDSKHN